MSGDPIVDYLTLSRDALQAALDDGAFRTAIAATAEASVRVLTAGGKILLAGNGGSAGDAQHIAGEIVGRMNYDRAPLAAIALTTDTSILTAVANDYGYAEVFARQVLGLGRPGDVFFALSTSGNSPNILKAIDAARQRRLTVIGFTGRSGGAMAAACDLCLRAPADATPVVQQLHLVAGHLVCGLIEERLFPRMT